MSRDLLFRQHRAALIATARRESASFYASQGSEALAHLRKANTYTRAARELNRQYLHWLKTQKGKTLQLL